MQQVDTLIIGASVAGLATAASLKKKGMDYLIIEKENQVAMPWRNHYDRLHLHTSKRFSHLPYKKFGSSVPRYASKNAFISYLEEYQKSFHIQPLFNTEALDVHKEKGYWVTGTSNGMFRSKYIVMATGVYNQPRAWLAEGIKSFAGNILHSSSYKTGKAFTGQRVLVIGFGNSACEIAMDLYEQGAMPFMSVRSPVNVVPRDLLGIPVQELSLLLRFLPPRMADKISAPLIRMSIGDPESMGLKKMPYGPLEQIQKDAKAPVLDIGTVRMIREGHIQVVAEAERLDKTTVFFKDGSAEDFSSIILCTGYEFNLPRFLQVGKERLDDLRSNINQQKVFGKDGLYFCGYWISPTGQIREIALDAKKIAGDIAGKQQAPASR